MRALRCNAYGPPRDLMVEEIPDPEPSAHEVVIDVHAAAVNFPDVLIVQDEYQISAPVPFTPGGELAGIVRSVGADVTNVAPGDRVCGTGMVGAFAEQIAMPATSLTHVPDDIDLRDAAAFGVVYFTAYHTLRSVADVQLDEWVAVLGAAGGVGLASVEVAKVLGARVIAAASSDDKLAVCRERGADATINYDAEDLKTRLKELTDGGADVVVDPVGGPYAEQALRSTRFGGRFVTVGFASGEIPRIPLNLVLLKGVAIKGFEFLSFAQRAPDLARRDREELLGLFAAGRIRPHVSKAYRLDDAATALHDVAERRAVGKVLIDLLA
ncbi:MAG: NADPH:quinone oxidoreductase family protein [Actinobacteria bacterium]|nr:NADPH:quinone oxidoreductase family protein [Actinomycetota bacterium]